MGKTLYWTIIIIFLVSCYRRAPGPVFDDSVILSPDSMVSLLKDVHLVEGTISSSQQKDSVLEVISSEEFNLILSKYGLDRRSFEENIRYYSYRTEELDQIYEKVIIDLGQLESKINLQKEEHPGDTAHLENTAEQE